ncbi:PH (Pleckstrin Homology) domain-containing protein [Actinocorallia herbida]|uniref:PH (Pleckstrin Homology) domain-containing protein n=1 Tax=Actinocorallia herbida TaxID=58109 RepID=A0A3N1CUD7_9ACTN|nr:PH domain-containing protein [Actinocorallia herbida]ROO84919.1 PH (Pleckstrin Homology) domain-containing protein [Actinocorallia herbida]
MTDVPEFLEFRLKGRPLWEPISLILGSIAASGLILSLAESTLWPLAFISAIGGVLLAFVFPLMSRMFVRVDAEGVAFRTVRRRELPWPDIAGLAETSYAQSTRRVRCPALRLRDGSMLRLPVPHSDFRTYEEDLTALRAFFVARLGPEADLPPGKHSISEAPPDRPAL